MRITSRSSKKASSPFTAFSMCNTKVDKISVKNDNRPSLVGHYDNIKTSFYEVRKKEDEYEKTKEKNENNIFWPYSNVHFGL